MGAPRYVLPGSWCENAIGMLIRPGQPHVYPEPLYDVPDPIGLCALLPQSVAGVVSRVMVGWFTGRVRPDAMPEAQSHCYTHVTSPLPSTCRIASTVWPSCHEACCLCYRVSPDKP